VHLSRCGRAGEAVEVVGENGAGNSTLLRICAGLSAPDSGNVVAHGRGGYCPQYPGLVELLTTDEHLALFAPGLGLTREQAARDGRKLLSELAFQAEDQSQARHLSGGARQKLNHALALLGDARVLLLDDPYQGFDHGSYVSFWQHVARWKAEGRAVLIVTHLLADTALVDSVVELSIPSQPRSGSARGHRSCNGGFSSPQRCAAGSSCAILLEAFGVQHSLDATVSVGSAIPVDIGLRSGPARRGGLRHASTSSQHHATDSMERSASWSQ
jgi:ABC-type Na+ transport system ATPase subunit NatA